MVDLFATPSSSVSSSRPLLVFLEALLLGKAAQTTMLLETMVNSLALEKRGAP